MDNYRIFFTLAEVLGVIVVITIGLVAANTAAMSIRERRAEIAVMRSIGFPSRMILSLLLAESLIIGLLGGMLGCGSAFVVLKIFAVGTPVPDRCSDSDAAGGAGRNAGRRGTDRTRSARWCRRGRRRASNIVDALRMVA